MASWMNVEARIRTSLKIKLKELRGADVGVGVETPADLESRLFVRISLAPGGSDDAITDSALLDVEAFAPTKLDAGTLAEDVRSIMITLGGTDVAAGGQLIDAVTTRTRPYWMDYRNPKIHRYVATYRVTSRIR